MKRNAKIIEKYIGKTISGIQDVDTGSWTDDNGFIIEFTDGTGLEIGADSGQGAGYVIVGDVEKE